MATISYTPKGVCSRKIDIEVEDGIVKKVHFTGGCNGNTQGVSKLVEGMKVQDVIDRLEGIDCNGRGTSCPAQLAEAFVLGHYTDIKKRANTVRPYRKNTRTAFCVQSVFLYIF